MGSESVDGQFWDNPLATQIHRGRPSDPYPPYSDEAEARSMI